MKRRNDNKDFVTYRTAKALMEAGYPQSKLKECHMAAITAPHLWDAVAWLREKQGINIVLNYMPHSRLWYPSLADMYGAYGGCLGFPLESSDYRTTFDNALLCAAKFLTMHAARKNKS